MRSRDPVTTTPGDGAHRDSSFNQSKHFAHTEAARLQDSPVASWLAVTFEIVGELDLEALESAFLLLARRHEVLRCSFERTGEDLACTVYEPDDITLRNVDLGVVETSGELRTYLFESFCRGIDTMGWPLYVMGAVVRDAAPTTVYLAFDHIVSDGMSMLHVVNDLQSAYAAFADGRPADLPEADGYVKFAGEQRDRYAAIEADDDRLDHWRSFVERGDGFFPPFSLDLGLEPGRMYPTLSRAEALLSGGEVEQLEIRCREVGGSFFMGLLAAVAVTLRDEGGPETYRGLLPVSERGQGDWGNAVGWFVNTLPIEFTVGRDMDFGELLGGVKAGFKEMMAHSDVPFVRAWELFAPELFAQHSWPYPVNFFSYIDTRRFPGSENHPEWKPALHVWALRSNGTNSWFVRDASGLHVHHMYADTPQARRVMLGVERTLRDTLARMVHGESDLGRWRRAG